MDLRQDQITRYSRHLLLPEVGRAGQERLLGASVLVVGLGGLGCPAAQYLAAAGVGRLGLADGDTVDLTNLQRQVLHGSADLGKAKTRSAMDKLTAMNPDPTLVALDRVSPDNALDMLASYDLVIDGSDNFATKFLINDACVSLKKPLMHAGILRYHGQIFTVLPGQSACYRCVFETPPPAGAVANCAQAGVLGAVAGVLGTLLANEALKMILGLGQPLTDRMLVFDALNTSFRELPLRRRPDCPSCARVGQKFQPEADAEIEACEVNPLWSLGV